MPKFCESGHRQAKAKARLWVGVLGVDAAAPAAGCVVMALMGNAGDLVQGWLWQRDLAKSRVV